MVLGIRDLAKRAAGSGLAALVATVALAIVVPIAHGHLAPVASGATLAGSHPADGTDATLLPECPLCLASGHGAAALDAARPDVAAPAAAEAASLAETPAPHPAARRGPASPRAPPATA